MISVPAKVFLTHAAVKIEVIANDFDRKRRSKDDIFFLSNVMFHISFILIKCINIKNIVNHRFCLFYLIIYLNYFRGYIGDIAVKISEANTELCSATPFMLINL